MKEKIQRNRSAADVYWEKKAEGYQRKKQGSVRMRIRGVLWTEGRIYVIKTD